MSSKVWVVIEFDGDKYDAHVFTSQNDAEHYANERLGGEGVCACSSCCPTVVVVPSVLVGREEIKGKVEDWGVQVPDVNESFVEGLMEEIDWEGIDVAPEEVRERFIKEKGHEVRREACEILREFLMDELKDYIESQCHCDDQEG
ncbi:hypothetical protein TheveDRAFT_0324 [Thermanaerovibrio velox DSM 12556]|uniref:Uncharacterized protein n=1 Tax=Thermanaerovibrio velox DSM 12556 TaxID=926567 RepID=H0UP81_9BACT|nr:hypothetical protein [Thermanaerovibrio velox]EHM09494.1 hypothetical protein TheveDRAFT_0324 [Thermanaerovibrio velox DSM 12556]